MFLATASFISALLFVAGIVIAAINGFSQYDQTNQVYMSATFVGGLVLALLSGISLAVVFSKKNWQVPDLKQTHSEVKSASPIEEAISLLVNDFVTARRSERERRPQHQSAHQDQQPKIYSQQSEISAPHVTADQIH